MGVQFRVISIGALARNRLWNETEPKRLSHATTTLIRDGSTTILVDPGLPPEVLQQRLDERTGRGPEQVDMVFLTCFRPVHRRALALFGEASWLMHAPEIEAMQAHLQEMAERHRADGSDVAAGEAGTDEVGRLIAEERGLLGRVEAAQDRLTGQVHLFPSPGVTPGSAGLLLAMASRTVVVAGDAVLTQDHYETGQVYQYAASVEQARYALAEIIEIADEVVPGHDNHFRVMGR
jgi:glyoxylase-like metal-dependent hydrolase (beta-lactamase superfamily II)